MSLLDLRSGRRWLVPAFGGWIDEPGDRGRDPRDAPSSKDQEKAMGPVAVPSHRNDSQQDHPDHKATDAVLPVVVVGFRHAALHSSPTGARPPQHSLHRRALSESL